jgi:hypothetical protein
MTTVACFAQFALPALCTYAALVVNVSRLSCSPRLGCFDTPRSESAAAHDGHVCGLG